MSLKAAINEDLKTYMREKNTYALEAIRMLKAEIKNTEIDKKEQLDDDGVLKVLQSAIKKNKEAAEIYEKAGRQDLVDKEKKYIEVLSRYMPQQLTQEELDQVVREVMAEMGDIDPKTGFGTVMKAVMAKVGNTAEGKLVSAAVKKQLQG